MSLKLRKENLIVCPDQAVSNPPSKCIPLHWLRSEKTDEVKIFDVDGYIVDFIGQKVTSFFIKREYSFDDINELNEETLTKTLETDEQEELKDVLSLSTKIKIPTYVFFWPNNYPFEEYKEIEKPVYIFEMKLEQREIIFIPIEKGDKNSVQKFIAKERNFSFKFVKPLKISKSYMECYLSKTSDPWPGDLDGIIQLKKNNKITALLEFKTHNLESPIEDERVDKYQEQDLRRFKVISYLQRQIGELQDDMPPILFIVWGHKQQHQKIKIQAIKNLQIEKEEIIDSPMYNFDYKSFYEKIISY